MGTNPDCTVILGTVWLATLGDYTCNEARGTLSFFNPGLRTRQRVTLTSRCQQSIRKQQNRLNVLEITTAEARAEIQRAKRHGKECYKAIFSISDEGAKASPLVSMAENACPTSCIQTSSMITTDGTAVSLLVDWDTPHKATVEYVPKLSDMFNSDKDLNEVRLHGLSAEHAHLEGRVGEVVQASHPGRFVVELYPSKWGEAKEVVKVPLGKLLCNPGGKEYLRAMISKAAQAYSVVTVDDRDALLYPFGKHQPPEEEVRGTSDHLDLQQWGFKESSKRVVNAVSS
jgi:hypothetical protein